MISLTNPDTPKAWTLRKDKDNYWLIIPLLIGDTMVYCRRKHRAKKVSLERFEYTDKQLYLIGTCKHCGKVFRICVNGDVYIKPTRGC